MAKTIIGMNQTSRGQTPGQLDTHAGSRLKNAKLHEISKIFDGLGDKIWVSKNWASKKDDIKRRRPLCYGALGKGVELEERAHP